MAGGGRRRAAWLLALAGWLSMAAAVAQDRAGGEGAGADDGQAYWTIVGVEDGPRRGLLARDGAAAVERGGFSIEPIVIVDGQPVAPPAAAPRQSLQDGYLPIPSVDWRHRDFSLRVTAFATGDAEASQLVLRYRLANTSGRGRDLRLALVVAPSQGGPAAVFPGAADAGRNPGVGVDGGMVAFAGVPRVFAKQVPDASFASPLPVEGIARQLASGRPPGDAGAGAGAVAPSSAVLAWCTRLDPGGVRSIEVMVPMTGGSAPARRWWDAEELQLQTAAHWRQALDRLRLELPPQAQALVDSLRTARAQALIAGEAAPGPGPGAAGAGGNGAGGDDIALPGAGPMAAGQVAAATIADRAVPDAESAALEDAWSAFVERRDRDASGGRDACTACDWRLVGAWARQGWRDRAWQLARWLLAQRTPPSWNQWLASPVAGPQAPDVAGLPDLVAASDFVRSTLDMFAHPRASDDSIVLAAGVPSDWIARGIGVRGLQLPQGALSYSLRQREGAVELELSGELEPPAGGLVFPWPWADEAPGATTIDGMAAAWEEGGLRIHRLPARVLVARPGAG